MKIHAPWEKSFNKVITPLERFIHAQTTTGIVLMVTTILALIIANTAFGEEYFHLFHTKAGIFFDSWELSQTVHHWINDGLMAIFFFIIGLEIKREVLIGELSNIKVSILPILAAVGGMIFPALIYYSINMGGEGVHGWGVPMATDIAFAISALVLLGNRVPTSLVTFLIALAIVDDLGAVLVIAIFYTEQINMLYLGLSGITFSIMILFNRFGIHKLLPYFIVSILMWYFMLQSGVHATIAGIMSALTIPSIPKRTPSTLTESIRESLDKFDHFPPDENYQLHTEQKLILNSIEKRVESTRSPAARLEEGLHLPVALIVIPLFALANAGVSIDFSAFNTVILEPISLGIILGLIVGKILGVFGISWLAIKLNVAQLPKGSNMSQVFGVSLLAGIGFTMSMFIAELAFKGSPELIFQAKIGIMTASLIAGILGFIWLRFIAKTK